MDMKHLWAFIILLVLVLAGCNVQVEDQKVVLWTDSSEFLAYAQVFNSSQNKYKVEVTNKNTGRWDVAIGPKLNRGENADLFVPLESLFSENGLDKDSFYQEALEKGVRNQHQILLPLSFDVDAFFFLNGKFNTDFTEDDFFKACQDFNTTKTKYRKSAFSPYWNPMSERLFAGRLESMVKDLCGGVDKEKAFREKYFYKSYEELLKTGRILFWHSNVSSYYALPDVRRKALDFRYVRDSAGKIAVYSDILWVGIPKKSANTEGACAFIKWLMDQDVQQSLILKAKGMDIRSFGLAGGFSANKKVNTGALPKLYPFIMGHIPTEGLLKFID